MKRIILGAVLLMTCGFANANPFESFVGEYVLVGEPVINAQGGNGVCKRFAFDRLTGLTVNADDKGYNQSHMLKFLNAEGWFGHPIMDYKDSTSSAKTTGDDKLAINEYLVRNSTYGNKTAVSIGRSGNEFILNMEEVLFEKNNVVATCYYQANLMKK